MDSIGLLGRSHSESHGYFELGGGEKGGCLFSLGISEEKCQSPFSLSVRESIVDGKKSLRTKRSGTTVDFYN